MRSPGLDEYHPIPGITESIYVDRMDKTKKTLVKVQ